MWSPAPLCALGRRRPGPSAPLQPLTRLLQREYGEQPPTRLLQREYRELPLPRQGWGRTHHLPPRRFVSNKPKSRRHPKTFPVLDGRVPAVYRHVFEANLRNSEAVINRYSELLERVKKGGGENAVLRHTQRNKKLFVRERLRLLLDDGDFLELSPLAGLDMPYGDVPAAGCLTGIGKICGVWCVFIASDATVKGGTIYPIGVKKQLRAQEIAMENRLLSVHLVDSGGAFLPLQSELFPDKLHGGRIFYNEAIMSAMGIPQVAVVCGSCVAGGAYVPTMAEESVIIDKTGTLFLAGPPLVKAATGEDVSPEDLGGARLHSQVSGCTDHFAPSEEEAYECIRNVVSTLNCEPVPEEDRDHDSPLYSPEELLGLAPLDYGCTLPVKLILSRLVDGSRLQEFKAAYGTTLVTGFGHVEGYGWEQSPSKWMGMHFSTAFVSSAGFTPFQSSLGFKRENHGIVKVGKDLSDHESNCPCLFCRHLVGIVANNGELAHDAALKGSHFVQLCGQRGIPILFLQNTAPQPAGPASISQCGRSFSPNFLFLWPNARVALVDSRHFPTVPPAGAWTGEELELKQLKAKLEEESSAFYSSSRLWDDGIILPQDTRKVIAQCLEIMEQKKSQAVSPCPYPIIRM
ncbi:biotin-dependent 3-methylcrotonyl-coenzyme A carboxylase beta1 subunit-like isoform X2 [Corvus hawaiiensis]|uniref:biotin-dependent 3-methylcrotonyl-coenzyme A carboxylase beta1 subunit-like isoform X2 n=1 Tax=Corvus hawaiiensis TaxID=134902 RepID=UPI002018EF5D|nr:biotin-dependent 3-methylcrotonyl-coenzyme A carboxylase beta1 subunit-like isoform X2 [Corvus hawaiiensis]